MSQAQDKNYTLAPFSKEEGEAVVAKLTAFLNENGAELAVSPIINSNGTLGAKAELFKKVELVPKAEGIVSPIQADDLKTGPEEAGKTA